MRKRPWSRGVNEHKRFVVAKFTSLKSRIALQVAKKFHFVLGLNFSFLMLDYIFSHSWDDMAKSDLPATIDYILKYTKSSSLSYVGHSQGTTIGFAEYSRNQTWVSKVDIFIALAPVAYVGNMISPLRYLADFTGEIEVACRSVKLRNFVKCGKFSHALVTYFRKYCHAKFV